MFIRILISAIFFISLLSGCAQNAALLAPAYTLATSGNIYNAGLTYGSNEVVTMTTGMSTSENIKKIITPKKKDSDFEKMVKKRIIETRKKLNLSNQ